MVSLNRHRRLRTSLAKSVDRLRNNHKRCTLYSRLDVVGHESCTGNRHRGSGMGLLPAYRVRSRWMRKMRAPCSISQNSRCTGRENVLFPFFHFLLMFCLLFYHNDPSVDNRPKTLLLKRMNRTTDRATHLKKA